MIFKMAGGVRWRGEGERRGEGEWRGEGERRSEGDIVCTC